MNQRDRIMTVIRDALKGAGLIDYTKAEEWRLEAAVANIATVWWGDVQFYEEDRKQLKELADKAFALDPDNPMDNMRNFLRGRIEHVRALAQSVQERIRKDEAE